jgi:hypothetical protein
VRDGVSAQMNTQSHTIFWPKKVMVCWQMTTYCCSRREQRQCTEKTRGEWVGGVGVSVGVGVGVGVRDGETGGVEAP